MNNTILAILHTLNILAFVTEIAVKSAVHIITFTIVVALMTKEFVTVVYNNRREILEKIDNIRNSVGYHFVYANWRSGTRVVDLPSKSCIVVSVEKSIPKMINNDTLEMLSAREQLMEDIESIVESKYGHTADDAEDLIVMLCDAVVKNFPTN